MTVVSATWQELTGSSCASLTSDKGSNVAFPRIFSLAILFDNFEFTTLQQDLLYFAFNVLQLAIRSNRLKGLFASWKFGMDNKQRTQIYTSLSSFARKCIFGILSVATLPNHIAFIMDGNRRYSKQHNLVDGEGHKVGYSSLMSMLRYCYELGVKYVTSVRLAAERAMDATAKNSKALLLICIAYISTDEILHSVEESCEEKWDEIKVLNDKKHEKDIISVLDIERHMYMAVAPDPDVIIRTSVLRRLPMPPLEEENQRFNVLRVLFEAFLKKGTTGLMLFVFYSKL
ncbi:hypothetical protein L1987_16461 [Smallanthus sonchifolius]|uniref:Uncharacterized protein n=1 Tax=Smallanthus sonchifolius TaxID=185202 RepID=A0ACB9J8T1_9ASTR|nr:hypothetical protein L1987_16461 [Smallanthus sonchifolius]